MTEIEIKAHVRDPEETALRVAAFASFTGETIKRDVYWSRPGQPGTCQPLKVRIRDENGNLTVTYKRKEVRGAIEVNDEREFTIDSREAFETFIADAGFSQSHVKEKRMKRWACQSRDDPSREGFTGEIGIELSLVERLGWFLEIEVLADAPDEKAVEGIRLALLETLARCGIPESALESRFYTEMLSELD